MNDEQRYSDQSLISMESADSPIIDKERVKGVSAHDEQYHAHLHEHADGTVHNHFHRHPGGDQPHAHTDEHAHGDHDAPAEGHVPVGYHVHSDGAVHKDHQVISVDTDHAHEPHADYQNAIDDVRNNTHEVHEEDHGLPEHTHRHAHSHRVALVAHNLAFSFPRADKPVFENISFEAHAGAITAILGNNGAGKSTLLNLLGNLSSPSKGMVEVGGKPLAKMSRREIARHVAYVTQQQRMPHLTVYDEVLLGRKPHISWSITENDRAVVAAAIESLGIEPFVHRYCDELSGGERQKVYIARALAQETEVLLLDEPTSALDPKNQMEVLNVVRSITQETSLATIMVIHDVNLALRFSDYFLLMRNGEIVSWGGRNTVTSETLSRAYDMPMRIVEIDGLPVALA